MLPVFGHAQMMATIVAGTAPPAASAPVLISSVCGPATPAVGGGTSASISTTGANSLLAVQSSANPNNTPTDSLSNTFSSEATAPGGAPTLIMWSSQNPSVGAGYTITTGTGSNYPVVCVLAFSNMSTTALFESGTSNDVNSATSPVTMPTTTPTFAGNNVIVTAASCDAGCASTMSISAGYSTPIYIPLIGGAAYGLFLSYKVQVGTASAAPVWTASNGSNKIDAVIGVFKGAN